MGLRSGCGWWAAQQGGGDDRRGEERGGGVCAGCVLMVKYVGILCHPYLLAWHDDEGLYNAFLVGTKVLSFSNL